VGVMACDDEHGLDMLNACQRAGLRVPDEVAVVGVNNDEHICGLSNPPLSSIDVNPEYIGYEAAALLDRLMSGAKPPEADIEYPPRELVVRQSSDVVGVAHPQVAEALRYIRAHVGKAIDVTHVANAFGISRSKLDRLFVKWLGRTVKEELLCVQLAQAKKLLTHTDLPIAIVAEQSGFGSSIYFHQVFRQRIGCTAGTYRRTYGLARSGSNP
jgi:LacI family transcriptional regulator